VATLLEITGLFVMMFIVDIPWGVAVVISLLEVGWFAIAAASTAGVETLMVLGVLTASVAFNPEELVEGPKEIVDTEVGRRISGALRV
jgi:hypothetical protein